MIEKYLNKKITRNDLEVRMLNGSLQDQYAKLFPRKHQDSLYEIKYKATDSIAKVKRKKDSIVSLTKPTIIVKKDTVKKVNN